MVDELLTASIKTAYAGNIDYNDQIYMPALFGGTFPQFPLVLVDEAQDLSPVNHRMLHKLVKNRTIAVGDPWQSIYGFRGAQQNGMHHLMKKFSMSRCDLSVSFRCPQAIVENARWRVPHFKWHREGGSVENLTTLSPMAIPDSAVILCRNNAPLFRVGFHLLEAGRSVSIAGSDIGPKVLGTMKKLGDAEIPKSETLDLIEHWRERRLEAKSKGAGDIADCMRIFASYGNTLGQAISYAEHLFAQQGTIRLFTGHKAKGLEFPIVYHLDPWLIGDDEQELNLRYVIQTRASENYYEINSKDIK